MKIFLIAIVMVCCVLIAIAIVKYYNKRKKFYVDLCNFCNNVEVNITYNHNKLLNIVASSKKKSHSDFVMLLDMFEQYTMSQISKKDFSNLCFCNYLSEQERFFIADFFINLGNMSQEEEIKKISICKKEFEKQRAACEEKAVKFASIYFKLIIIFGIFIAIIFF